MFDRFGIGLGAVLASQMASRERMDSGQIDTRGVQDGLGIVLFSSYDSGSLFEPLGCLLESFWGVFGLVLGHLGLSWARFWALRVAFWNPITLYAHQLINASTLQPVPRQHFVTRAGGLRAERLNPPPPEGSERVWTDFEIVFEFFELKESSQGPCIPQDLSKLAHLYLS